MTTEKTLHTCPTSGTTGFTARGLKAHRCDGINRNPKPDLSDPSDPSDPSILEAEIITEPTITEDFAQARIYLQTARAMASGAAALTILLGCELKRLHAKHGIRAGGDRRSDQKRSRSFLKWRDIVAQELGISHDTARNYMALAEKAQERLADFQPIALQILETPLGSLPEIKRTELLEKTRDLLPDSVTARQLMWDWGIQKPRHEPGGNTRPIDPVTGERIEHAPRRTAEEVAREEYEALAKSSCTYIEITLSKYLRVKGPKGEPACAVLPDHDLNHLKGLAYDVYQSIKDYAARRPALNRAEALGANTPLPL